MSNSCFVCGGLTQIALDLPKLPLTDTYGVKPELTPAEGVDQKLCICPQCGHGQLATLLSPAVLYGGDYSFRTGSSASAVAGCEFFLEFLDRIAPRREFKCVLDVGCNDLHLLSRLNGRSLKRIGIDPVLAGREGQYTDSGIDVIGSTFEDVELDEFLPDGADLIVARHTLEHIHRPVDTVRTMLQHLTPDGIILVEVPGFHALVKRRRYDQIFHQHTQYFSPSSLHRLVIETGGELLGMAENYHHWGATLIAFRRTAGRSDAVRAPEPRLENVIRGYAEFRRAIQTVGALLADLDGPKYGYGAAQMLPVLAYHLGTDLSCLIAVLDDDQSKDGIGYWNLPVKVKAWDPSTNLSDATVLVTAVDNVAPIMRRLLDNRPKHLLYPLQVI